MKLDARGYLHFQVLKSAWSLSNFEAEQGKKQFVGEEEVLCF